MCDKRIASLKQLTLKPQRPVQQVTPKPAVPLQPQGGAPSFVRRKSNKVNQKQKFFNIHVLNIKGQQNPKLSKF